MLQKTYSNYNIGDMSYYVMVYETARYTNML